MGKANNFHNSGKYYSVRLSERVVKIICYLQDGFQDIMVDVRRKIK